MQSLEKTKNQFKKNVIIGGTFLVVGVISGGGALIMGDLRWLIPSVISFGMAAFSLWRLKRAMRKLIDETMKEVENKLKGGE